VVQIELKTLEVSPNKAMQQIVDYKNDAGSGYTNSLMCFMQLFIVSNKSKTFYFANNNNEHFAFNADEQFLPVYTLASEDNRKINHLFDFADKFLSKCTLGQMISRYMVLVASEQKILVMRPYQIYAVKAIVDCIHQNRGNGYIWHTTGSGKTLTSFKASTLLKDNPDIEKCLFVVDRKDLDRQTRQEFNKFQEGSVEENTNTGTLVNRMLSTDYADKVIVTTIQKLGLALNQNSKRNVKQREDNKETYYDRLAPLRDKRVVFIFDECHRSQFGDNHDAIKEFFPNAQLFGFTGTPIFEENATYKTIEGDQASYKTTDDVFQQELHSYTITNAIEDKNVLRFHIDYFTAEGKPDFNSLSHKMAVIDAILKKHDKATHNRRFNAVLATSSISDAIEYYHLFKQNQREFAQVNEEFRPLNIACVFSPPAEGDKDIQQIQEDLPQEKADNQIEPNKKKEALTQIIADYNTQYGTNHKITEFDGYYQDVQQRIKFQKYPNKDVPHKDKIDVMIVVDMLLTGFDSKYLNTLYVDKNLKYHGLIQAFSRTNRIYDATKTFGNIITFRDLEKPTIDTITLFGDKNTKNVVLEKSYQEYLEGFTDIVTGEARRGYTEVVKELNEKFPDPDEIATEKDKKEFTKLFGEYLRVENILQNYDEFAHLKALQEIDLKDPEAIEAFKEGHFATDEDIAAMQEIELLPERTVQDYRSTYNDIRDWLRREKKGKESEESEIDWDDVVFEIDLLKSQEINLDYILELLFENNKKTKDKASLIEEIRRVIRASIGSRAKESLVVDFINDTDLDEIQEKAGIIDSFFAYAQGKQKKEASEIIKNENLNEEEAKRYITASLKREYASENGTELNAVLPKMSPLNPQYLTKKQSVFQKIASFVEKFKGVGGKI